MEMITDITKVVGKTVKSVTLVEYGALLGLIFTDDTYCILNASYANGDNYLQLNGEAEDWILKAIGIITEDQYKNREQEKRRRELAIIATELKKLAELKRKYEGN